jgi:hypothetical protein
MFTDLTPQIEKAVDHTLKQSLTLESSADTRQLSKT